MQCLVGFLPRFELLGYDVDKIVQVWEIAIMSAKSPRQFPYSFDRIEFWAVRWQEVESNAVAVIVQPRLESIGMMPTGIVDNNNHNMILAPMTKKPLEEQEKTRSIEFLIQKGNKLSIGVADITENANALSGWCMKDHRIGILRGHPHGAS